MSLRKRLALSAGILAGFAILLWLTSAIWLRAIGSALISDSPPSRADAALVLAGDIRGSRIMKACELLRDGLIPVVLVSGPMEWYGINEADLAVRFAASRGCPAERLEPLYIDALSTTEEVRAIAADLERRGIKTLLLVTSNYHSARALRTFRRHLPADIAVTAVAAPDRYFSPDGWWRSREGQKTAFFEVSKTIAEWIGL